MTLRPCFSTGLRVIGYFSTHSLAQTGLLALFTSEMLLSIIAKYMDKTGKKLIAEIMDAKYFFLCKNVSFL